MKQLICVDTGIVKLVDVDVPTIQDDEMLIRLNMCGICGTDLSKIYDAQQPKPVHLGHEIVGTIIEKGQKVENFQVGQKVVAMHHIPDYSSHHTKRKSETMDVQFKSTDFVPGGFAEFIKLSALHVQYSTMVIPDGIPEERAVFTEPLACVLRSLHRINVIHGDNIAVIGVGSAGLLFLPLLHDLHANILACDISNEKLAFAKNWYANDTLNISDDSLLLHDYKKKYDIVIITVCNEKIIDFCMTIIRDGGTILVFGVKPDTHVPLNMFQIWRREINIITSYSATPDLISQALAILKKNTTFPLENIISHKIPLTDTSSQDAFKLIHKPATRKIIIIN